MTDWIFPFQSRGVEFGYCVERWRATRSVAWLIAALEHADVAVTRRAREGLDAVLGSGALQAVLVPLQIDADEAPNFLMDLKPPAGTAELLDSDATQVLNRETPYRYLKEAVLGGELAPELEREALVTAFTRGLMLGEDLSEIARKMDDSTLTRANLEARDRAGKRFAAAFLLLHRPEARPYYATGIVRQAPVAAGKAAFLGEGDGEVRRVGRGGEFPGWDCVRVCEGARR